jgi:hypothetical protein
MSDIPWLQHKANCPVGGNFACACGAEEAAMERLTNAVTAHARLQLLPARDLVNLALEHMPDMPFQYEQVIEELCSRVYPNWPNEDSSNDGEVNER